MDKKENIRLMHSALSAFNNTLVSTRFAVAGLYIAASAFLAQAVFVKGKLSGEHSIIGCFGLVITFSLWILEIRNIHLLENIGARGKAIEIKLGIDKESCFGYFWLMEKQDIPPKVPFIPSKNPKGYKLWRLSNDDSWCGKIVEYIISHSFGLSLVYLTGVFFWIYILMKTKT